MLTAMAVPGTPQELLQQLHKVIQTSQAQKTQSQLPRIILGTAGNQAVVSAGPSTTRQSVMQVLSTTHGPASGGENHAANPAYTYKVRIINPTKRSDVVVHQLNKFTSRFVSVAALRTKLREEFKEQVSSTVDFNVGYCDGSQQARVWLVTPDDLDCMYLRYKKGGPVTLWCDGRSSEEDYRGKRKREGGVGRQEKEEEVESILGSSVKCMVRSLTPPTSPVVSLWYP